MRTVIKKALIVLVFLDYFIIKTFLALPTPGTVYFLDVGQGDATLILSPEMNVILYDGGPDETVLERLGETLPFFMREIDMIVLSHPHKDHLAGLMEVVRRYKVKSILIGGDKYESLLYTSFVRLVKDTPINGSIPIRFASSKLHISFGSLTMQILHPEKIIAGKKYENTNNASVVSRFDIDVFNMKNATKKQSLLITGDCEIECEHEILHSPEKALLDTDILKVGHHGSRTSSSNEFLDMVTPSVAIIQSGVGNTYEHPHKETLEKLKARSIEIHRNDQEGTVAITL